MSDATELKSLQAKKTAALKLLARENAEYQKLLDKGLTTRAAVYKRDNIDVTQKRIDEYDAKIAPIMSRMTTAKLAAQNITPSGMPQPNIQAPQSTPSTRARTDAEGRTGFATPAQTKSTSTTVASPIPTTTTPTVTTTTTPTVTPTVTPPATSAATGGKGKGKKGAANTSWEETFKKEFPQYAYLLDETIFGADMTELLRRSITEKWYEEDDSIATQLFTGGLTGTNYYRTTTTNQQNFDKSTPANKQQLIDTQKLNISQTYGELQLNDETITGIATKAARDGKTGKALELLVYQAAFAAKPETAEMPVATPVTRALTSTQADQVRAAARKYGQFASNNDIQSVLTGATTLDNLTQNYKLTAKRIFRGLAQDIDSGLTVEQVFDPYRRYAASVLEKPLESIDLFDAAGKPTNFQDAIFGNEGPLSLGDWVTRLKSDDKYGYQFTNQARQQATNLVMEMEKAFGFRR